MEGLCEGLPWRFENTISNQQATQAAKFLQEVGFSVDITQEEGEAEPLPVPTDETEPAVSTTPLETESSYRMGFQGDGRTLFGITFINLIKTIFTLGFYRFWAKTRVRQYLWGQTRFLPVTAFLITERQRSCCEVLFVLDYFFFFSLR